MGQGVIVGSLVAGLGIIKGTRMSSPSSSSGWSCGDSHVRGLSRAPNSEGRCD
jgi:hypothetical protein